MADYGCVMVFVDFPQIKSLHKLIKKEDIYTAPDDDYGLEDEPHITVLYGLHKEVTKKEVKDIMSDFDLEEKYTVKGISIFDNPDYDVLKFDVESKILSKYNEKLKELPFTSDYPEYHPHLTIGYIKKGKGKKYVESLKTIKYEVQTEKIIFSTPDKQKIRIL